jgi:hypothetical protein
MEERHLTKVKVGVRLLPSAPWLLPLRIGVPESHSGEDSRSPAFHRRNSLQLPQYPALWPVRWAAIGGFDMWFILLPIAIFASMSALGFAPAWLPVETDENRTPYSGF